MERIVEPARPDDGPEAVRLITETDVHLFGYCTGGDLRAWETLAEWEWRSERGICSFRMSHVVRGEAGLLGLLVSYTARRFREIDWSFGASRPHTNPDQWGRIVAAYKSASFLFPALPDDAFYVQNLVAHPSARGSGLGRRLMDFAFDLGRAEGCRSCHLDVDSTTPAVRFYERLGMQVLVKTEVPALTGVPAHYRMVKVL